MAGLVTFINYSSLQWSDQVIVPMCLFLIGYKDTNYHPIINDLVEWPDHYIQEWTCVTLPSVVVGTQYLPR